MPNGDSVITGPVDPFYSITQGVLILPYPGQTNWYIVFSIGYDLSNPLSFYSVVDMTLDGGTGDVIPGKKGILLDSIDVTEKCTAVRHANGRDWWIVQYQEYHPFLMQADSTFNYYLLTPNGVSFSHSQTIGLHGIGLRRGEMVFSEDGMKLGFSGSLGIQVYGFDRCSGLLTDPLMRLPGQWGYGGAFSPSGRFYYFSTEAYRELYQYDLEAGSNDDALELIHQGTGPVEYGQLELGVDGKVYLVVNQFPLSVGLGGHLQVVTAPDELGLSCGFEPFGYFLEGNLATFGLPNMPNYDLGRLEGSPCDTVYAIDTTTSVMGSPAEPAWSVVPTVSSGRLTVLGPSAEGQIWIQVYNATGGLRQQHQATLPADLDLTSEPAGTYLIKVQDHQRAYTVRVVKR